MRSEGVAANVVPDRLQVVPGGLLDAAGWEAVYREHVGAVYRFLFSRLGNRPDAEDLTANVFERALPRLQGGAAVGQLRAYLINTARTALADHWRQRHGVTLTGGDALRSSVDESEPEHKHEAEVEQILASLPDHYRQVLELRFLRGYSLRETASAMSTSVGNVKVMQLRALRRAAMGFGHE